jgi:hypothetical protein
MTPTKRKKRKYVIARLEDIKTLHDIVFGLRSTLDTMIMRFNVDIYEGFDVEIRMVKHKGR